MKLIVRNMNWMPVTIPVWVKNPWLARTFADLLALDGDGKGDWFSRNGYPSLSWQIDLFNRLGAAIWLCVPHTLPTDEGAKLVRHFASRAKHGLIVEWSNETWNSDFLAYHDCLAWSGDKEWIDGQYYAAKRVVALRQAVSDLTDVRFVLGCWLGVRWTTVSVLEHVPDVVQAVDALAIGAYFGMTAQSSEYAWRDIPKTMNRVNGYIDLAQSLGLAVDVYESGQHLLGKNAAWLNRSAEMGQMYAHFYPQLVDAGVENVCLYSAATKFENADADGKGGKAFGLYEVKDGNAITHPKTGEAMAFLRGV